MNKLSLHLFFIFNLLAISSPLQAKIKDLDKLNAVESISSIKEACQKLNHKLLIHIDQVYYFKNCALHLVPDVDLVNAFIQHQKKTPVRMNPEVYAALPLGKDYKYEDYEKEYAQNDTSLSLLCHKYNKNIVSTDDKNYYYIENCKKRKFMNYADVEKFGSINSSIYSISPLELKDFPEGKSIIVSSQTNDLKKMTEENLKNNLPDKKILCKNLNKKVAAFYESFFYVEKCVLHPIVDFNMELQVKVQAQQGVQDLSVEQILGLEQGNEISSKEVLKKIQ